MPIQQQLTRRQAAESDIPFLLELRHLSMDEHLVASGVSTKETDFVLDALEQALYARRGEREGASPTTLASIDRVP